MFCLVPPTNSTLEDYASFAYGIGPNRRLIVQSISDNRRSRYTTLVGLNKIHSYIYIY